MNPSTLALLTLSAALSQLPPSPDPVSVPIRGVVVDASDRPAAGADVWLADAQPPDQARRFGLESWWSALTDPGEGTPPILVHAQSGADGTFARRLPAEAAARRSPPPLAIWAVRRDGREVGAGVRRLPPIPLADDPPVRLALGPPAATSLRVLTPDGKPAAGAHVVPTRLGELPIPEPIGRLLAAEADNDGRARIEGLAPSDLGAIRVEARGFGVQDLRVPGSRIPDPPLKEEAATIMTLAPVGRIVGRLTAPHGEPIRGAAVRATSKVGGYDGSGQEGTARADCDEQGRFEVPAIAAGLVALELEFDPAKDCPLRGEAPGRLVLRAGQTAEVAIPMRQTLAVRGLFREKGTGRPIAGVKVALNGRRGGDRFAVTDASGRFAGRIPRDETQPFGWPVRDPLPFYESNDFPAPPQRMPKEGISELDLPPAELRRGAEVRGTVAGEDGRPIAGALVEAIWHDSREIDQAVPARSDRAGRFLLRGIDPNAELDLTAWDGFAASKTVSVRATTAEDHPIALTLSPTHAVPLGGRVVDPEGRPIPGATVRLRRQVRGKDGRALLDDPLPAADGTFVLHTGADGRYRARGRFPANADYYAEATAPGRLAARSAPAPAARASAEPPVLVLHGVGTIEGRVLDRRGEPIAGAVVRQSGDGPMPTEEAPTAADGRFRLLGVLEGPALVVAEKSGFRPSLQVVAGGPGPIEVVLTRRDEPPAAALRTLPPALPVAEEKALALRLIEPLAATVLARGDDVAKHHFLGDAAGIDPQATIEWLDEVKFGDPLYADEVRAQLATALARDSLDDATAILEASTGANTRAYGYAGLVDLAPDLPRERRRGLLDQALLHSKNVTPMLHRLNVLDQIAERLIDLGEVERARAVLDEGLAMARGIAKDDKTARHFPVYLAVALSRLDLAAAVKIVGDIREDARKTDPRDLSRVYDRYYGRIALRLADRSPADAEAVLGRMDVRATNDRAVVATCVRMAPRDLARARRIAATRISPDAQALRPYTIGLMAQAIAATDLAAAVRLLDEAFDELGSLARVEPERANPRAAIVAAALLPAVETADPGRLADFLARTLLMRGNHGDQSDLAANGSAYNAARLAMLTARYDRGLALHILRPELDRLGSHRASFGQDYLTPDVLAALATIDPRRAVAMVEALPEDPLPGTDPNATKGQARRSVARMLALHGDDRSRMIARQFLNLWTPDQKDQ